MIQIRRFCRHFNVRYNFFYSFTFQAVLLRLSHRLCWLLDLSRHAISYVPHNASNISQSMDGEESLLHTVSPHLPTTTSFKIIRLFTCIFILQDTHRIYNRFVQIQFFWVCWKRIKSTETNKFQKNTFTLGEIYKKFATMHKLCYWLKLYFFWYVKRLNKNYYSTILLLTSTISLFFFFSSICNSTMANFCFYYKFICRLKRNDVLHIK